MICFFCCGILGIGMVLGISRYMKIQTAERILPAAETFQADCILIFGCGVKEDGTPSFMLRDRLEQGILLYQAGAAKKLLMSGDHGSTEYDEVNAMKSYAMAKGVPSTDIFMDHAGFSTYDSLYRARDVFGVKKVLLVTQAYHLPRAIYVAERLGLDAYGVPAKEVAYGGQTYRELREILARGKDFCTAWVQPKPTYLGEEIPISGDGDLTNDIEKAEKGKQK